MLKKGRPSEGIFTALLPLYDIFITQMKAAIEYLKVAHNIIVEDLYCDYYQRGNVFLHVYEIDDTNVTCKAYIGYKRIIYRDISISISLSIFRYIREDSECYGGIFRMKNFNVKKYFNLSKNLRVEFFSYDFWEGTRTIVKFRPCLTTASYTSSSYVIDEIGKTSTLPNYVKLRDASYSLKISGLLNLYPYSLVGTNYYAPNYDKSQTISCVLVALTDNEYDSNAIKVLRWFPAQRLQESPSPDLYELGYIARTDNAELHAYMSEKNKTDILFGKITGNTITILGGLELFVDGQYKNIELPIQLSNHIQL